MTGQVIRVSLLRCRPEQFAEIRQMMIDSAQILGPGIRAMQGLVHYYAGADEADSSLSNVSVWQSLADAKQMDRFQPMLELGKQFAAKGATFERSVMNYDGLWEFET